MPLIDLHLMELIIRSRPLPMCRGRSSPAYTAWRAKRPRALACIGLFLYWVLWVASMLKERLGQHFRSKPSHQKNDS